MLRKTLLAVIALALAAACTGGSDATETPTAAPPTSPPATSTPSPTSEPSTPTPTPSVAPTAAATATPLPEGVGEYGVVKVHRSDPDGGLNMRTEPSAEAPVAKLIPPNATGLVPTDSDGVTVDGATWIEVAFDGTMGWVNANFVTPLPSFDEISCGDPASDYSFAAGAVPPVPAPGDPDADHIFGLHHIDGPQCERTVITFGREFSFDADFDALLQPADGVPGGIALAIDLATIRVALSDAVIAAASTATQTYRSDNGAADLFFVRPSGASRFGILALWDRNRGVRYFFLENPGRLVIDTVDAPTDASLALGPLLSGDPFALTFVTRAVNVDTAGPAPEPPLLVAGYARPFEATTTIRLRTVPAAGDPPGSGTPVNANWSGSTFADPCGSTYAVMTSDWLEAWGEFEFSIQALAPGEYELFVGEDSPEDGSEQGVYHVFTVGGSTQASC